MERYSLIAMLKTLLLHPWTLTLMVVVTGINSTGQSQKQMNDTTTGSGPAVENPFDKFQQFSAVMSGGMTGDPGRKLYRSGKLMRSDFSDQYRITDIDAPVTWVVFTKAKEQNCARFDVADAGTYPFWGLKDFRAERARTEGSDLKETAEGHSCKVDAFSFLNSKTNPPVTLEMKLWEAEDLHGFPVKIEVYSSTTNRRYTIRYSDVSLQTPDPSLFDHPATCGAEPKTK